MTPFHGRLTPNHYARQLVKLSAVLVGLGLSACAEEVRTQNTAAPPERTEAEMLTLKEQPSEQCPTLKGTYLIPSETGDTKVESVPIVISDKNQTQHVTFNFGPKTFAEYVFDKFLFDEGGMYLDGRIRGKTESARNALTLFMNTLDSSAWIAASRLLQPDLVQKIEASMRSIEIPKVSAGYVGSCRGKTVRTHFVLATSAFELTMTLLPNKDIEAVVFALENGTIKKESNIFRFESHSVPERRDFIADQKGILEKKVNSMIQRDSDSSLVMQLGNSQSWTLERVSLEFVPLKKTADNKTFLLKKAFRGSFDALFDDVEIEHSFKSISISTETMKIYGLRNINGTRQEIGDLVQNQHGEWMVVFKLPIRLNPAVSPDLLVIE